MRDFELKAEADMRLYSDRRAAELARKRREKPAAAEGGASRAPAPADGPPAAGTAEAGGEESEES
ncbi:hypothetical protein [Streptomyces chattanoogensis]|uniref:hypothetical protein n=1 Tax=Streptomyces chattanoogensis TaxID=66876 RepID=UPI0005D8FA25|nr:hypothetical protein T261_6220 [Streptomyces lydicus]